MTESLFLSHAHKNDSFMLAALYQRCFGDTIWQASDFASRLDVAHIDTLIVKNKDNIPLGMLCYQYDLSQNDLLMPPEAEIILIGTDKDFRRQGIASMLLNALDTAKQWHNIFLDVAEDNVAALNFYHKHGYIIYNRRKSYYQRADGTRIDALLMKKSLKE
ncbi:MAG: GNAT family N-acetyltransferase [Alphaproteobacteria bacterium]|nr:GNAT family N-acetyltransferase [Alphaproteobacteria bacterium]